MRTVRWRGALKAVDRPATTVGVRHRWQLPEDELLLHWSHESVRYWPKGDGRLVWAIISATDPQRALDVFCKKVTKMRVALLVIRVVLMGCESEPVSSEGVYKEPAT